MNNCPKCQSQEIRKDGIVKHKQRYKCKSCNYHFTVEQIGKPDNKKRDALLCYLLGFNYRTTGELLQINHVTAYNWVKRYGGQIDKLKGEKPKKASCDELNGYITKALNKYNHGIVVIDISKEKTMILFTAL
jgi:transposase-like protein